MIRISKLTFRDVATITQNLRSQDFEELMATQQIEDIKAYIHGLWQVVAETDYAFVAKDSDGNPVTAFGMVSPYPGVWNVWLLSTPGFGKIATTLTKKIKRDIMPLWLQLGHRFQCVSHENNEISHKWLRFLGFEKEVVLKKYGKDQKDFIMFSIVR